MNQFYPQSGAIPRPNASYPMANMQGASAYAAPLNYNQPKEVISGYDARINPMTGQELPDANFARGGEVGLASLLASRGRGGDSMLVHMNPEEVKGLQALALAHGGSLTVNPDTGLVEALSLKSILPQIAGAVLNTFAPNLGTAIGTTLGFKDAAASNIGTGLLVGGIAGLVEGDLQKGLMAGLGAYSGATLASGLGAAQKAAAEASRVTTAVPPTAGTFKDISQPIEPTLSSSMKSSESALTGKPTIASIGGGMAGAIDRTPPAPPPVSIKPSLTGGIRGLFTQEGREAFGKALGGGFESPFAQNLSRYATFAGALMPFAEQPKAFPVSGAGEDIFYIPGEYNPLYGTGRDQPRYQQGQYYKRTSKGFVPINPFAKGFADGGIVGEEVGVLGPYYGDTGIVQGTPGFAPAYSAAPAAPAVGVSPFQGPLNVPAYAAPTNDPNVLATRAYIEELNRRVRAPYVAPGAGGEAGRGLSSFGGMGLPISDGAAGADVGGGAAPGIGDIAGGIAANYLINKGIGAGVDYLRDQFTTDPTIKRARETPVTDSLEGVDLSTLPATQAALAALNPYNIPAPPQFTVGVEEIPDAQQPSVTDSLEGVDLSTLPATQAALAALNPYNVPAPQFTVGVEEILDAQQPVELNADLQAKTQVGGDLSRPLSSYLSGASTAAGLANLGKVASIGIELPVYDALGNVIGYSAAPGAAAAAAGGAGAAGAGATGAGAGTAAGEAGLGSLSGKIIPGVQTALGAYEAFKGIQSGNEARAALGGLGAGIGAGTLAGYSGLAALGPIGLAAGAIAALGASLVNTKEMGDVALRNYWRAIDQGRGFGQAPPKELAEGFINFYRTNKNEFPGQGQYGRKGNEEFLYDMTKVINKAVEDKKIAPGAEAGDIYKNVVEPWINSFGFKQNINSDAKKVQDFLMTDIIYNFMQGKPFTNAMVKGDTKYPVLNAKYAGQLPESMILPTVDTSSIGRQVMGAYNPFIEAEGRETNMPTGESVPLSPMEEPVVSDESPAFRRAYAAYNPYEATEYGSPAFQYAMGGAVGEDYNFGFAQGGSPMEYRAGGKFLQGPGDGMSDDIRANIDGKQEARLADGEFVIPADVVSHLGNGSSNAGAKKLHQMMARVRQARTGKKKQAPAVKMDRYLPA